MDYQSEPSIEIKKGAQMARRVSKEVKEEILSKFKAGERVVDLASQYGVSTITIYY